MPLRLAGLLTLLLAVAPSAARADAPLNWSAPVKAMNVAPGRPVQMRSVDCPTTTFCVAVDEAGNVLTSSNPTGPAEAWTVTAITGRELAAVSCASVTLCVAVGSRGTIASSTNPAGGAGAWQVVEVGGDRFFGSVSCPSASLCVAVDGANAVTSTNPTGGAGAWSVAPVAAVTGLSDVSCPKTNLCVAVGDTGQAVTATNPAGGSAAWSSPVAVGAGNPYLRDVSCFAGTAQCRAIDYAGNVYSTGDVAAGSWTPPTAIDAGGAPVAISCISPRCAAIDLSGNVIAQKNAGFVVQNISPYAIEDLNCPSFTLCVAVTRGGTVLTSTAPFAEGTTSWTSVNPDRANELLELSCASETFCATMDRGGNIAISTAPAAATPAWTSTPATGTPSGLSCVTATFCASATPYGDISTSTDPGGGFPAWTQITSGSPSLGTVSCPTTSLCVVGGPAGKVFWSTNPTGGAGTWQSATVGDPTWPVTDIDCPTATFCVGANVSGLVVSANPAGGAAAWSQTTVPGINPYVVSCASPSLCVTFGDYVYATSTNPLGGAGAWTVASLSEPPGFYVQAVDCAAPSTCVAADGAGRIAMTSTPTAGASAWTVREVAGTHYIGDVDCPTSKLCVVIDKFGYATVGTAVPVPPPPAAEPGPGPAPPAPGPVVPISQPRDTTAPNTVGLKGKISKRKRTARFTFRGTDKGAPAGSKLRFQCRLDKGRYASCRSPKSFKKLRAGRHTFYVRARDSAGNTDKTPARLRFRI